MAILKIRDAEGNVQEITAIKGDSYLLTKKDKQDMGILLPKVAVLSPKNEF